MFQSTGIAVCYHGCEQSVADAVLQRKTGLQASTNTYDWLGHGVYFWEGSESRAKAWARNHDSISKPAVIGAYIRLGNCLDLLDTDSIKQVSQAHALLVEEAQATEEPLPQNTVKQHGFSFKRDLDCKVIERLKQFNKDQIIEDLKNQDLPCDPQNVQCDERYIDSVRGMFPEGPELYPGAGFRKENHIQICVINPNCIVGYFAPRNRNYDYKAV